VSPIAIGSEETMIANMLFRNFAGATILAIVFLLVPCRLLALAAEESSGDPASPKSYAAARAASEDGQIVSESAEEKPEQADNPQQNKHQPSYRAVSEADEVVVIGKRRLREEEPIGNYNQPRWTATPRFFTTSIYLVPAGTFEFDCWNDWKFDMSGDEAPDFLQQFEVEIGIGHRLQFDIYLGSEKVGWKGPIEINEQGLEMRYAFADWGRVWGNPTIYLDFVNRNSKLPEGEIKLLLGGEMAPHWHWGSNLIFEREFKLKDAEQEYTATFAFSYAVVDQKFSIGLELKGTTEDGPDASEPKLRKSEEENRDKEDEEKETSKLFSFEEWGAYGGPSLQWRPVPPMYIDLVAFFGVEKKEDKHFPVANPLLLAGWEF